MAQKINYIVVHIGITVVILSRSESGVETRSQTFRFLLDILSKKQVSTDILDLYTLQDVVEFVIQAFFLDIKVLMLPVVYEKYNFFLIYEF